MDYNVTYRKKDKTLQCIISYKDENGKWKQKSKQGFKAQKDAKIWINKTVEELEEQIELNSAIDPGLKDITFKKLMDKYIAHKKVHRENGTIHTIETARKKFNHLNDMKVIDITKADTQYCIDLMVKEGLAHSTLKGYIARIKTAFSYAINDIEIIKDNPLRNITIPENKIANTKIKALTKNQLNGLLNKILNPTYKLISILAGTCGLRIGEIIGLNWDNIDFVNSTITINGQWKVTDGWKHSMGSVKRQNSNRVVPVPAKTMKELKLYKKLYPIHTTKRIFYTRTNTSGVGHNLSDLYEKLGYDITVHDLRHTYATLLLSDNSIDYKTVAKLLGHDVQETIKTYSHVNDDMMERATNTIKNIF
jgi:integrase